MFQNEKLLIYKKKSLNVFKNRAVINDIAVLDDLLKAWKNKLKF